MKTIFFSLALIACLITAQSVSAANNKMALVIGNSKYKHAEILINPARDAKAIAEKLRLLGFEVLEKNDLSLKQMKNAITDYNRMLDEDSISVVYYAGHGVQKDNRNYLIPIDANIIRSYEIEFTSVDLQLALSAIDDANPKLNLVLLDACRDNPFEKKITGIHRGNNQSSGLTAVNGIHGTILSYATQPGNIAVDGKGDHSPYAQALLNHLATPGVSIQELLNNVGLDVLASTGGNQVPWFSSSPIPGFCLAGCDRLGSLQEETGNSSVTIDTLNRLDSSKTPQHDPLKFAIQNKNLDTIRELVELTEEDESRLTTIFSNYNNIVIAKIENSRSLSQINEKPSQRINNYLVLELTNHLGNRVLPSDSWRKISFNLRKTD